MLARLGSKSGLSGTHNGSQSFDYQVPGHPLRPVSGHPLQFWVCQPWFDGRRTMVGKIDFADPGVSVEEVDAVFYANELNLFTSQSSADGPAFPPQVQNTDCG